MREELIASSKCRQRSSLNRNILHGSIPLSETTRSRHPSIDTISDAPLAFQLLENFEYLNHWAWQIGPHPSYINPRHKWCFHYTFVLWGY